MGYETGICPDGHENILDPRQVDRIKQGKGKVTCVKCSKRYAEWSFKEGSPSIADPETSGSDTPKVEAVGEFKKLDINVEAIKVEDIPVEGIKETPKESPRKVAKEGEKGGVNESKEPKKEGDVQPSTTPTFSAEHLRGIIRVTFNSIAKRRGDFWKLDANEEKMISEPLSRVINKRASPLITKFGDEITLGIVLGVILLNKYGQDQKEHGGKPLIGSKKQVKEQVKQKEIKSIDDMENELIKQDGTVVPTPPSPTDDINTILRGGKKKVVKK